MTLLFGLVWGFGLVIRNPETSEAHSDGVTGGPGSRALLRVLFIPLVVFLGGIAMLIPWTSILGAAPEGPCCPGP